MLKGLIPHPQILVKIDSTNKGRKTFHNTSITLFAQCTLTQKSKVKNKLLVFLNQQYILILFTKYRYDESSYRKFPTLSSFFPPSKPRLQSTRSFQKSEDTSFSAKSPTESCRWRKLHISRNGVTNDTFV